MMVTSIAQRLSLVFEYPCAEDLSYLTSFISQVQAGHPPIAAPLSQFKNAIGDMSLGRRRELYTSTFDLSPNCAPYLSVHLFGDDSPKRATLMTGLVEAYESCGAERKAELPDHVAVVLRSLDMLAAELRRDLVEFCLRPSLVKMRSELLRRDNPYHYAVAATQAYLDDAHEDQEVRYA